MVKYAIVDSGLNNIYVTEQIIGGISFRIGCDGEIKMQDEFEDDNGHGTMVFQIIREKSNPEDEFYIVKVLEENNKGSSSVLLESKKFYQKNNSSIWIYGIFKLSHLRKIQTPRKELFHV